MIYGQIGDKYYGKKEKKLRQETGLESGRDPVRREVQAGLSAADVVVLTAT